LHQPFCDGSGVGFGAYLAENSTPLWSHHSIPRSDETWLPEWSGKLGGEQRWRSPVAWGSWGKPVFRLTGLSVGRKSGLGGGCISLRRNDTQAERRPGCRGMEAAKFGHDFGRATKLRLRC
jgi:hypothetical protein